MDRIANLLRARNTFPLLCASMGILAGCGEKTVSSQTKLVSPKTDAEIFVAYGKSSSCKSCHEEAWNNWQHSHHALAERELDLATDRSAFDPPREIQHGSQSSRAQLREGKFEFTTPGPRLTNEIFPVARVIGVDPLRQFLIPLANGRLQAAELCFDPNRLDWFNVYGNEDRQPGEWGHWTGRGMNWNSMCATCHNTRFRKNYAAATDAYRSSFAEMGVSCEACHGPMAAHNGWHAKHPNQPNDPTVRRVSREEMFSVCAQCHARRGELTGEFAPGDNFFDHHTLSLPDESDLFFADGQIHDEDYEFNAFLGSKMHAAGVRCVNCHEPHSAKLRVPGNLMCLSCHSGPAIPVATNALNTLPVGPRVDPATHSRHKPGTSGDNCTDCHMPQTVYMQRHARHDHGFTIPDPRLTLRFGIPNACNRCHTNQTAQWALERTVDWFGPRTNNAALARVEAITLARAGDGSAVPTLIKFANAETNYYWRAAMVNLLHDWSEQTNVAAALLHAANDTNALVRSVAVRALEHPARNGNVAARNTLQERLKDASRSVRVDAAWALRATLDTNTPAALDLLAYLDHNADQPTGLMQRGVFLFDRGDASGAVALLRKAVDWDPNSAPLHDTLAVVQSTVGDTAGALASLRHAVRLAPTNAQFHFRLALALNDSDKLNEACAALNETVRLDPRFARAWYCLGLAQSKLNQPDAAIESLVRAESLDTTSAAFPYARATILARQRRVSEARTAASRALELNPNFTEARELLRALE